MHHQITKLLGGVAVVIGLGVAAAAPAVAHTSPFNPGNPFAPFRPASPFSGLNSDGQSTKPADGPAQQDAIDRGLREGLTAALPGLR